MIYDKQNKKTLALKEEIKVLLMENDQLKNKIASTTEILNSTLHEVRRFSAQISKFTERLSRETEDLPQLNQTALSALYTANMISSRLAYTDTELNPRAIESQAVIKSVIYKKFDKARRILAEEAKEREVAIKIEGGSRVEIDALPAFELLPFVLLENAIKYSPRNQEIKIKFETILNHQVVTVQSIGPLVSSDELPQIFNKGFRGVEAYSMPGEGLGLYLAKRVCEYHDVKIKAESGPGISYQLNGKNYATFSIQMDFM